MADLPGEVRHRVERQENVQGIETPLRHTLFISSRDVSVVASRHASHREGMSGRDEWLNAFPGILAGERTKASLTQEELSEQLAVDVQVEQDWEHGRSMPLTRKRLLGRCPAEDPYWSVLIGESKWH